MWILGSFRSDFLSFFLPGLVTLALVIAIPGQTASAASMMMAYLVLGFIGSGHVYTTAFRTFLSPRERAANPWHLWAPLAIIGLSVLWMQLRVPYFWAFVVYSDLFHNMRQYHGLSRWYQKLNGARSAASSNFLYALTLGPFVLFHFRDQVPHGFYTELDLFERPDPALLRVGLALYGAVALAWLGFEFWRWRRGQRELNRFLSLLVPITLYGYGFLVGRTVAQILFPILLSHGVSYLFVMERALGRTDRDRHADRRRTLGWLALTAFVFGMTEFFAEGSVLDPSNIYARQGISLWHALVLAIYIAPLLTHHLFDAYLWRGTHPDAQKIYAADAAAATADRVA